MVGSECGGQGVGWGGSVAVKEEESIGGCGGSRLESTRDQCAADQSAEDTNMSEVRVRQQGTAGMWYAGCNVCLCVFLFFPLLSVLFFFFFFPC